MEQTSGAKETTRLSPNRLVTRVDSFAKRTIDHITHSGQSAIDPIDAPCLALVRMNQATEEVRVGHHSVVDSGVTEHHAELSYRLRLPRRLLSRLASHSFIVGVQLNTLSLLSLTHFNSPAAASLRPLPRRPLPRPPRRRRAPLLRQSQQQQEQRQRQRQQERPPLSPQTLLRERCSSSRSTEPTAPGPPPPQLLPLLQLRRKCGRS